MPVLHRDTSWQRKKNQCAIYSHNRTLIQHFNHLITEHVQYAYELRNLKIPNTLGTILGQDVDTITQVLKSSNNTKLYNSIKKKLGIMAIVSDVN